MRKKDSTGRIVGAVLIGLVAGGAIGAALSLLFAPDKGSDTRRKMFSKGSELSGSLKDKFTDFVDEIKKEVGAGKVKSAELVDNGGAKLDKLK